MINIMRLKDKYSKEILPQLREKFSYKNNNLAPKLTKVVVNVGFGRHHKEKELIAAIGRSLEKITGQKPVFTVAKKSISAFKIRDGLVIGAKVTMRGQRMYDFVEKLVNITFPLVRDFRGISDKSVDRGGNLTVGFKEYNSFPEVRLSEADQVFGLEICLASSAKNREEGLELFRLLGFPFKKDSK